MSDTSSSEIVVVGAPGKDGAPCNPPKASSGTTPQPNPDPKLSGKYKEGWPWTPCSKTCQCAKDGVGGGGGDNATATANPGGTGGSAPTFALVIARLASDISVSSQGGKGGKGGKGQDGGDGGNGQDSGTNDVHCVGGDAPCCKPAVGGLGGKAGNGANSGVGGPGGNGGDIYIYYTQPQTPTSEGVVYALTANSVYGLGGLTGDIGKKGSPGTGGKNEQVEGLTIPPNADSGSPGRDGLPTSPGQIGNSGHVYVKRLFVS